ncbi:MAG: MotA/TolQ/ExbB proton channel family protein [Planctomycetaceae bacterium]
MSSRTIQELTAPPDMLSWHRMDIEQRLSFPGGRFTRVNTLLSLIVAILLTGSFYLGVLAVPWTSIKSKFTDQGAIPYFTVFIACWCLAILVIKWRKLAMQKRCLGFDIVPQDAEFILSPRTINAVMDRILQLVDDPKQFVLMNRITIALSNLRNLGRVSDVDEILRSQAETDEAVSETSYILLTGFVWAIPILGFIGTVLGLSVAIGNFGGAISAASGSADALLPALKDVTGGLGIAFDTTLVALIFALFIQLCVTFLKKSEQEFLDACSEYCTRHIVNRLRLLPFGEDDSTTEQ